MMRMMWLAASALLAAQTLAWADEAYAIKLKQPGVGEVILVDKTQNTVTRTKHVDNDDKTIADVTEKVTEAYVYRETVLAQESGKAATKLRREYDKAQINYDGEKSDLPYHGKTVLIEKQKDGKFHFRLEGGKELTGDDAGVLESEFNVVDGALSFEQCLLPIQAVKVDEVWKLDMAPIVKILGPLTDVEADVANSKGTGQVLKVYTKGDRPHGHITARCMIPVKSSGVGKDKAVTLEGSQLACEYDIDGCIDGRQIDATYKVVFKQDSSTAITLGEKTIGKLIKTIRSDSEETDKEQPKK